MRVGYVCADPGVPAFGSKGASVHLQEIVRAFRRRGAEVRLYCTRTGDLVPADLADLPVHRVRVGRPDPDLPLPERTAAREVAQARAATRLAEQLAADGADLVYERYSLFSTALAQATAALGVPGVLEVNAPLVEEQRTHRDLVDADGAAAALRTQVAAAGAVACVSTPVARWVSARTGRRDGVVVVPNGVDPDRVRPQPAGRREDRPTVVFVGTLKPWHGVDVLLEAAARARTPWRVRLVGDGPEGPALRAQAARLGLDLDHRGAVAPAEVPAALAGAQVAAAPYPLQRGGGGTDGQYFSPLKVVEYAAAGLPTVASAVGQLPELVVDGTTGLLVPPSDPAALAAAIDALVADPARARAMGAAARHRAETVHSWEAVLERSLAPLSAATPDRVA